MIELEEEFVHKFSKKEQKSIRDFKEAVKVICGEYGLFTYKFTGNGIGESVIIYSHLLDREKDITDIDSW